MQDEAAAGALEAVDRGARADVEAAPPHRLGRGGAHVAVEAAERLGPADHQRGPDAERMADRRQLDPDVAAADHDQVVGPVRHVLERVVRGDREVEPGQGRQARPRADRDQDALGRVGLAVDLDGIGPDDPAAAVEHGDPGLVQHAHVDAVQAGDLGVAGIDQGAPVVLSGPMRQP